MREFDVGNLILYLVALIFSLSFHESAHAWTSDRFGDSTARLLGRVSLNPRTHVDPLGTLVIPIIGFITGFPLLGFAVPTPVDPSRWRDKVKAEIAVSAAGPISNFLLAAGVFAIIKTLLATGVLQPGSSGSIFFNLVAPTEGQTFLVEPLAKLLSIMLMLNLSLGLFNLVPIPPLDGSHVLEVLLPYEMAQAYAQIKPFGMWVLMALVYVGALNFIFVPIRFVASLLFV
ncbi:MAG TPA: site-2 protease family protein [Blastocatellia bacterium]|nr:site-2 protease family protein [Blastocatellia bacterium]